ncbi:Rossmann-fold NAD(P)-binding domain-containing protein [Flavisphingomonas formosensis]|uniref:hypothetical protein n=1 Tax=Flavisphingomonas formosensis TaxID=861534 RepID=UPI0012FB2F58|nr:hypothetical protein [Sphingomonas formosensis]
MTIMIGQDRSEAHRLANGLNARLISTPSAGDDGAWIRWREAIDAEPRAERIVVALFPERWDPAGLADLAFDAWIARGEAPLLEWMMALGAAGSLCADGGAIVAVADAPPPLDSAGLAPEAAIAEGVAALVRSLALSEGKRGVRANTVTTPSRLLSGPPIAPDPPLRGFPGTLEEDVLGAVRLLLSPDAAHLSGHCLPADRGRSW